ncbi:MAG: formate dehydrogenase subunit delta [Actinomycetia bacterium]|nr:formate dehydrogenase subunit delta [Actinomycetes bacterium]
MANQIAVNQAHLSDDDAVALVAQHLTMFWAPALRRDLQVAAESGDTGLNAVALRAVRQLQPA